MSGLPVQPLQFFMVSSQMERGLASESGSGADRIAVLMLLRFVLGVEKTPNNLGEVSLERTNGSNRNIDKSMLAASFHELNNLAKSVYVHNDKEAVSSVNPYHLTRERGFSGLPIRFNYNAGYSGTHWTPQQNE
ncbi:MAG: hypothetical protein WCA10_07175 [Terracidiphilus sp.]